MLRNPTHISHRKFNLAFSRPVLKKGRGGAVKSVTMLFFKTDFEIFPEREGEFEKRGKEQSSSKWEEKICLKAKTEKIRRKRKTRSCSRRNDMRDGFWSCRRVDPQESAS